ncbi:MAG: isoprenylcysteine carboxylmethyltransferase family protein [Fibrobacter sp.]|nr:isoprenylcysteine carboxylmethyltransferase family protein [Fibrobacter sp.]
MRKASAILYRFRGFILALFAVALIACPAAPFPQSASISEFIPYLIALFLYTYGILMRIWARQYIGQHTRGSTHEADELVTDGPYAHCRHPLYTSNLFIALGAASFHLGTNQLFVLFTPALLLFEFALARAEDSFLEEKFGDTWRTWALRTPMFPSRTAVFAPNSGSTPRRTFLQAFKADASTWFWFVFFNLIIVLLKVFTEYHNV